MASRPFQWFALVALCLIAVGAAEARQNVQAETAVPVTIITARDIERLPSCSRIVTGDFTVPPTPALRLTRTTLTLPAPATPVDDPSGRVQVRIGDGTPHALDELVCFERLEDFKDPLQFLYDSRIVGESVIGLDPGPAIRVPTMPATGDLFMSPVILPAEVQTVRGSFTGPTKIDVNGMAAQVLSQTSSTVYWVMPPYLPSGSDVSIVVENSGRRIRFTAHVLSLAMSADDLDLLRGQSTTLRATVVGPEKVLPGGWIAGDVSEVIDLAVMQKLFPDARFPRPGDPAVVFFRLENTSRETVSMSPSKNDVFTAELKRGDFAKGAYTYTGKIQSRRAGGFNVNGVVVAFFAPVPGTAVEPR